MSRTFPTKRITTVQKTFVTIKTLGTLSKIGFKPGMLVTKVVTKFFPVVTNWDVILYMFKGYDNVIKSKI